MKIGTLIKSLEKAKKKYTEKHGVEPVIWSWDEEGLMLCARRISKDGTSRAKKPYMTVNLQPPGV